MKRKWQKYINNNKIGADCQLVTAVNAYYYLTGKTVDDATYEKYVDLCGCRHGSAVNIEKIWKKLGIEVVWEGNFLSDLVGRRKTKRKTKMPLPIEFRAWSMEYGFHSTLIVNSVANPCCYRITNFKKNSTHDGWIFDSELYKYKSFCSQRDGNMYRLFGLKGDKKYRALKERSKRNKREWFKTYKKYYSDRLKEMQ